VRGAEGLLQSQEDLPTVSNGRTYHSYFYFCAHYIVAGPYATAPSFEAKFARLTYLGGQRFSLAAMRYTEEWIEISSELTLDECLAAVRDDPWFQP
jgi:hypothetical protein